MVRNCIFCKIVKGSAPSYKVYEDSKYVAVLDIFPNIVGQTLVMPKKHTDSYAFKLEDAELRDFIVATKKVAKLLEKRLKTGRVHMVLEGTAINHLHAKLYPALGTDRKFVQAIAEERIHFDCYPGYVTTLMGPRANDAELKGLQKRIIKG
jgi:diadenosine tetraphosphate (Ap4A) HIT family hydrolase